MQGRLRRRGNKRNLLFTGPDDAARHSLCTGASTMFISCAASAHWAPTSDARRADVAAPWRASAIAKSSQAGDATAARSRAALPGRPAVAAAAARAANAAEPLPVGDVPLLDMLGFTLIIDDIVNHLGERCVHAGSWAGAKCATIPQPPLLPATRSAMGLLGGGGPQALWGAQLQRGQRAHVALAAGVGTDLPPGCAAQLQLYGVDTGALVRHQDGKSPRAWQLMELDGRRHEVTGRGSLPHAAAVRAAGR